MPAQLIYAAGMNLVVALPPLHVHVHVHVNIIMHVKKYCLPSRPNFVVIWHNAGMGKFLPWYH